MSREENPINVAATVVEKEVWSTGEKYSNSLTEEQVEAIRAFSQTWLADFSKKLEVEEKPPFLPGPWGNPLYIRMNKYTSDEVYDFERDVLNSKDSASASPEEYKAPQIEGNPFDNPLTTKIAELGGVVAEYADGRLPHKHHEGVKVFFEELIHYVKSIEDTEKLKSFLSCLQNEMFSWSPNIFNEMSLDDQFLITAKANRTPEVQRWFGQTVVGEMVYELSYAPKGTTENICKKVDTLDSAEKIDVLKQCQMLGATAVGDGDWAREGFLVTKEITEHLLNDSNTLVSMLAAETLSVLDKEYHAPSVGVLRVHGARQNARLSRELSEDMQKSARVIESTFAVDRSGVEGVVTLPIASDAVGVFDYGFDLQGVGFVDSEELKKASHSEKDRGGPSVAEVEDLIDFFESEDPNVQQMLQVLSLCRSRYSLSKESCEVFNSHLNSTFSHEEYFSLFENIDRIEEIEEGIHTARQRFMADAESKNQERSVAFIQQVQKAIEEYPNTDRKANAYVKDYGAEIEEAMRHGDIEHAFSQAEDVSLFFNKKNLLRAFSDKETDEGNQEDEHYIVSLQKELTRKHIQMFKEADEQYRLFVDSATTELQALRVSVAEVVCDDAFVDGLYKFIKNKSKEIEETRTKIEVKSIKNGSLFDAEWNYLNKYSADEKELFLRVLFDPLLREKIGNDLHIDWNEVPLRFQIDFLNYLLSVESDAYEKLAESTKSHIGDKSIFLRTFLAMRRGGQSLGDEIINFTLRNPKEAQQVFTYFGELLDSADRAEELAESISHCKLDECRDATEKIRENLLNRAQKDLETALRTDDATKVEALVKTYVAEAKEYVALMQEVGAGNIEQKTNDDLNEEDRQQMLSLLQGNYGEIYKNQEDEEFKVMVKSSLENSFNNPNTAFKILRDKEKIISFNRFDTLTDHEGREVTYFGSFNADPAYSGVGGVMLEKTIQERLQDGKPMMAHCDPTQPISKKYIESGFIATSCYPLAGKPSFEIWRTQDILDRFASKNETKENLLKSLEEEKPIYEIRKRSEQETYPELEEGKVLTRYFVHNNETYLVFEEAPHDLKDSFKAPKD